MYRARVESVSGSKVFAGGKCLTCIGNKRVNVGDYIWSDGRCVYGHNRTPQLPLIITTPNNSIGDIPILTFSDRPFADKGYTYSTFIKGELRDPFDMDDTDPSRHWIMANDDKENVFLFEIRPDFYSYLFIEENNVQTSESYIPAFAAANIKNGNIFSLFLTDTASMQVIKNDSVIHEINLKSYLKNTNSANPDTPTSFRMDDAGLESLVNVHTSWCDQSIISGFIEDENHWAFIIQCQSVKETEQNYDAMNEDQPHKPFSGLEVTNQTNVLTRLYYFSSRDEPKLIYTHLLRVEQLNTYEVLEETEATPELTSIKFPIQDNYYYTSKAVTITPVTLQPGVPVESRTVEHRAVFSPSGQNIFNGLFAFGDQLTIYKTKFGYLVGVYKLGELQNGSDLDGGWQPRHIPHGLHLINGSDFTTLTFKSPMNQRLRPMKNIKNWSKRIKKKELTPYL